MGSNKASGPRETSCIIYFHEGFSAYLPFALAQASKSNPHSRLILLGDRRNRIQGIQYEHHLLENYQKKADSFRPIYQHFHRGSLADERRCIERWLYVAEFIETEKIETFVFLDSDMLLFSDLNNQEIEWEKYDAAGAPYLWGFCYFKSSKIVKDFADWILGAYKNETVMRSWGESFRLYCATEGREGSTFTDMALAKTFSDAAGLRVLFLGNPHFGKLVDTGILGGAFQHGRENIDVLAQEAPGGKVFTQKEGQILEVTAVHLAGFYKNHIAGLTGWTWPIALSFFRSNLRRNMKQLFWYSLNGFRYRRYLKKKYRELTLP